MKLRIQPVPSNIEQEIQSSPNLHSYLEGLSRGRNATPHSWLYEREASDETLARWLKILEPSLARCPFGDEFYQFDLKQVEKFGPQGEVPPFFTEEAQEVLIPLYEPSEFDDELALCVWFSYTRKFAQFLFGSLVGTKVRKPLRLVVDSMRERDTLSTNSGAFRFKERNTVRDEEIQDAKTGKAYERPAIILYRQYNGKLRPVWMYPMSMNLIENSFAQVIQDSLRTSSKRWVSEYLSPWIGFEKVKQTLTKQWPQPSPIVGGDTTKMDANMRKAQIRLVYEIVKWLFRKSEWDDLYQAMMQVNTIPLLVGPKSWILGVHGLASGSGWTQLTETVLQMFMAWLRAITAGMGIGDDFEWVADLSAEELVHWLAVFGLPANEAKQDVGTISLSFLQRLFHQGFFSREDKAVLGAYYPTVRALNSMLNPEKFHKPKLWNSDMFCARTYMILENTVDDPCFDEFVRFVVRGNRDLLPFARKSASELAEVQKKSRLVPGLNPSYNQEKREKPFSEFASIQLARTLK